MCLTLKALPMNKAVHVVIQQKRNTDNMYIYTVSIDGVLVHKAINFDARVFKNVKVWLSDPWHPAAKAMIRNLQIETNSKIFITSFFQNLYKLVQYNKR